MNQSSCVTKQKHAGRLHQPQTEIKMIGFRPCAEVVKDRKDLKRLIVKYFKTLR